MVRPCFRFDRKLQGERGQLAYESLKEFLGTTLNRPKGIPGAVISIQSFSDLVNFYPYLHCLVTNGCFMPSGWFYVLSEVDAKKLESLFHHKVLKLLLKETSISDEWVKKAPFLEKLRH